LNEGYLLGLLANLYQLLTDSLNTLFYILVMAFASWMVYNHTLTTGGLIAVFSVQASLMATMQRLTQSLFVLMEGGAAASKIFDLLDSRSPQAGIPAIAEGRELAEITLEQLKFRFPGRKLIFNGISLNIQKGRVLALTGSSGCGKSLLLQLIMGNFRPESGNIHFRLDGQQFNTSLDWRRCIGHVPQDVFIFSGSVLENISMCGKEEDHLQAVNLCREFGFDPVIRQFPRGYQTIIGGNYHQLSGGQKQMVGIARAILKSPGLLLLDEATSAMDTRLKNLVKTRIFGLRPKMAIVWVTHDPDIIRDCDDVYRLS
jgi:ABC-type bacteriocin/lantibiotic exporter with double-glycine peptidase domain